MYFYLLHIEEESTCSINLFGHKLLTPIPTTKNIDTVPCKINVDNIFSPFLLFSKDNEYLKKVMKHLNSKKITASYKKQSKKNFFYQNYPQDINFISVEIDGTDEKQMKKPLINKTKFLQKILSEAQHDLQKTSEFKSLIPDLLIKEYANPIEQFIIAHKIKGPSILHISNFEEASNSKFFVKNMSDIKFIKNDDLPPLKIAYFAATTLDSHISKYILQINDTKTDTEKILTGTIKTKNERFNLALTDECIFTYKSSEEIVSHLNSILALEKPSFFVYHNISARILKSLNLMGVVTCDLSCDIISGRTFSLQEICETVKCKVKRNEKMVVEIIKKIFDVEIEVETEKLELQNNAPNSNYTKNEIIKNENASEIGKISNEVKNLMNSENIFQDNSKNDTKKIKYKEGLKIDINTENQIKNYVEELQTLVSLIHDIKIIHTSFEKLNVLELSKQLTEISGNLLMRTMHNNRAERNEYLLLHECFDRNILFPPVFKEKKEYNYTGGLVLKPNAGLHETLVMLLDFNSLYPSIIQEYNICFSTVGLFDSDLNADEKGKKDTDMKILFDTIEKKMRVLVEQRNELNKQDEKEKEPTKHSIKQKAVDNMGFLPKILHNLVSRRRAVKDLIKSTTDKQARMTLETRQKALKLTANSIYGCLGANFSRFCNYTMASYITYKGRELLQETKEIAEDMLKMKVIYGDTDSIMIDTKLPGINANYKDAIKMSCELKEKINTKFMFIEIDVEKIIKKIALYTKKKYGCLVIQPRKDGSFDSYIEAKGLDFTRRDFASIANELTGKVFDIIMTDLEKNDEDLKSSTDNKNDKSKVLQTDKKTFENVNKKFLSNTGKQNNITLSNSDKCNTGNGNENAEDTRKTKEFIISNGNPDIIKKIVDLINEYRKELNTHPIEKFIINTQLGKEPDQYNSTQHPPYIDLALRLKKKKIIYKKGDIISYVIYKGNKNDSIGARTNLPTTKGFIDYDYYIENQILPCLHRILSVFQGFKTEDIGKMFGIVRLTREISKTRITVLTPCCQNSQHPAALCTKCKTPVHYAFYVNKVYELIRNECRKVYLTNYMCNECGYQTKSHCNVCASCSVQMKEKLLNYEFDEFLTTLAQSFDLIDECKSVIDNFVRLSGYRKIDLVRFFKKEIVKFVEEKNLF